MSKHYTTLADVSDYLDASLHQRMFEKTTPIGKEVLRYFSEGTDYGFEVGIEEVSNDREEPKFNHVYLCMDYDAPEGVGTHRSEDAFPNGDLMHDLMVRTGIYHHSRCFSHSQPHEGNVEIIYHIGFEKGKTSAKQMTSVLSHVIKYFAEYVELNLDMLSADLEQ